MKKKIPTQQVNVRLPLKHVAILCKAADVLEKSQVQVMSEALEMYARRKRVEVSEQAS